MASRKPVVLQIAGYKNSGKTTLAEYLVRYFSARGLKVGVIKHDGHEFDVDHAGTDSWRMTQAGAAAVAIASARRTAVIEEQGRSLDELLARFGEADLVIVEGFKREAYPKIVMLRSPEDLSLIRECTGIAAVVCWEALHASDAIQELGAAAAGVPGFKLGESARLAEWLAGQIGDAQHKK
ncbi:molybdopterin-guanine dinucleotide biosynthesis protein B [Paenibacillus yonginensis]|nr:molybdopterin-guanine dinucleotide biosynthesis protein B [Paenibacillus yonginensis]